MDISTAMAPRIEKSAVQKLVLITKIDQLLAGGKMNPCCVISQVSLDGQSEGDFAEITMSTLSAFLSTEAGTTIQTYSVRDHTKVCPVLSVK